MSRIEMLEPLPLLECFLKPPIELQLEIWNFPKLLGTLNVHILQIGVLKSTYCKLVELYSTTPVPVSLQACQESQREALRT